MIDSTGSARGRRLVAATLTTGLLAIGVLLVALIVGGAGAYVTTDKPEYNPGETVTILGDNSNGAGYLPGETVNVDVTGPHSYSASCQATVDPSGAWSCQVVLNSDESAYGDYAYTAMGLTSGVSESGTFEDDAGPPACSGGPTDTSQPGNEYVINAPSGEVVTSLCIKSGTNTFGTDQHSGLITADGSYGNSGCYTVSGLGTATATITRGPSPCKDISHIDFFTGPPPTTITVNKVCDPPADLGLFNLRIDGVTKGPDTPCGGSTGPVAVSAGAHVVSETAGTGNNLANYTTVISGACDAAGNVILAAGDNKTCTITNTLKPATFKVTKTFADGNPAEVDITLNCTSGTITPTSPATTVGQMVTFTITGFTYPGTTCDAVESGIPPNYVADNSACQNLTISPGTQTSCTITNDPASFKVTKTFSDGNTSEVSITLTCTPPSTISAPNPATTVGQMITFTITGFTDPGTTCSASESGVPAGYTTDNSACQNLAISDGAQTSCTITNTRVAEFQVLKDFVPNDGASVTVSVTCTSGTVTPASATASEASPAVFTVSGFTGDPDCTATESPIPAGYDSTGTCTAALVAVGQCTITNVRIPTLTVNKVCDPTADPGLFNLQIDGSTEAADAPCGSSTSAVQVSVGPHTVGETAGTGTSLANYTTVISGDCDAAGNVTLAAGENKTCTITNTRVAEFQVLKDFVPDNGASVTVSVTCTSGTVTPASAPASEASPAVFTVSGFSGDPDCTATESPIPAGYDSTGTCTAALLAVGQCTITNTQLEADPKITAVVVDCPDAALTNVPFNCQVDVTVHNNGPTTPVDVDIQTDLQTPFDCVKTPASYQTTSRTLIASTSQVVSFVWSITCDDYSFHSFPANSQLTLTEPGVIDTDLNNNSGSNQDTTTVSAETDVKVTGVVGSAPGTAAVNTPFDVVVDVSIHNNGPESPVKIEGGAGIAVPSDCVASPPSYQLFNVTSLVASTTVVVTKTFSVTCSQQGAHQIVICGRAGPNTLHVVEESITTNFMSAAITVDIDTSTPPLVPTTSCSILGDPPEICGDGIDNDGDTLIDEEPDTDGDGLSDCVDDDDDNDGFTDATEIYLGTDPLNACPRALFDSAWPADMDNNQVVNIFDVLTMKPVFGTVSVRHDLAQSGGSINIFDVLALKPYFGTSCS